MVQRLTVLILTSILSWSSFATHYWGQKGHRIVGLIAEKELTKKARKNISGILQGYSLAQVSNFMDEIKSDGKYGHMGPWHYCTIPDDSSYDEIGPPDEGDIIQTMDRLIKELKSKKFTDEDEAFALKCLVHLVGDIHQPLHVGNGEDRGGNDVKVEYFWESSNLHRVWDSGIIEQQGYSYTEYVTWITKYNEDQVVKWREEGLMDWVNESKSLRSDVYDYPKGGKLNYRYNYENTEIVNRRLFQAGIRLARILNEIYG